MDSAPDGTIAPLIWGGCSFEFRVSSWSDELSAIKERAIADGTFMKAPNGKPTNLTEKQWLQVRTKAFKSGLAIGRMTLRISKVVDENGEPLVVYHGQQRILLYLIIKIGKSNYGRYGHFFTPSQELATDFTRYKWTNSNSPLRKNAHNLAAFINVRNPITITAKQYTMNVLNRMDLSEYDSIIITPFSAEEKTSFDNIFGGDKSGSKEFDYNQYAVFSPNQIKSATDNVGTFDANNDDIRFRVENKESRQRADELMDNADDLRKIIPDYSGFLNKVFQQGFTKEQRKSVAEAKGDWYKAIERELATIEDAEKLEYIAHLLDADLTIGQVKYLFRRNLDPNDGSAKWQARSDTH